jgi:protein-tyrosine kinase
VSLIERAIERMRGMGSEPRATSSPLDPPKVVTVSSAPVAGARPTSVVPSEQQFRKTIEVDLPILRQAGLIPPAQKEHEVARQFRRIKLPLIEQARKRVAAGDTTARLIFVSSALPGEGKTYSSVNLAFSISREKDTEVLLVDGDVAKPHVTRAFCLDGEPGLVDALTDESTDPESLIIGTEMPGLSVLPAGAFAEDSATELLASNRMRQVVERLLDARASRIILIDSPPLLLTTEAKVLAALAGQVIMVVRAGATPQHAVFEALDLLGEDAQIGFILNQAQVSLADKYTGYAGYGGYSGYGGYGNYGTYGISALDGSLPGKPRRSVAGEVR